MALPGLDEQFDRRANTKQIVGAGGLPLRTSGRDLLSTRSGVPKGDSFIELSGVDLSSGSFTREKQELGGANVAHVWASSGGSSTFTITVQSIDADGNELLEYDEAHLRDKSQYTTSFPIPGDQVRVTLTSSASDITVDGAIFFTTGNEIAHAEENKSRLAHGQEEAGASNDTVRVNEDNHQEVGSVGDVPDGSELSVKALPGNSGNVFVGDMEHPDGITSSNGYPLSSGDSVSIYITDITRVGAFIPTSGDGFAWAVESHKTNKGE